MFVFWLANVVVASFAPSQADAAQALNVALSVMYHSGYWLRKETAIRLSNILFRFLALYATCAQKTLEQRKRRYAMVPKLHMLAHCAHDLSQQAAGPAEWLINPISATCQVQEDFIGRPSRLSRRVSVRSIHKSLLMRSLITYQQCLKDAEKDPRGMDGYRDL